MYSDKTYSNRVLIPFWVVHLIFLLVFIAVLAINMMELAGDVGYEPPPLSAFMFFLCVALILEPLEMVLLSHRHLEPWLFLSFQIYKSLLSTAFFIYEMYGYTRRGEREKGIWKVVWVLILALSACTAVSYYASLVYSAMVFRRHRKSTSEWDGVKERSDSDSDGD